jgi:hypothetical protein
MPGKYSALKVHSTATRGHTRGDIACGKEIRSPCACRASASRIRLGHQSGSYARTLITRSGKLELRVSQDRTGRLSTQLFERY